MALTTEEDECLLTTAEWQYIHTLIAADCRADAALKRYLVAKRHKQILDKIRPLCDWPDHDEAA